MATPRTQKPHGKTVTVPAPKKPADGRPAIIDEFGRIATKLEAIKPLQNRYEILRGQIVGWYENSDPAQTFAADGEDYGIEVGPRAIKRTVADASGILDRIGNEDFLSICTISLEKLDQVLLPRDQKELVTSDRTGPRVVRAVPRLKKTAA